VIAVLDYGMGNLRSVEKALEHVGATAAVTNDHARAREAEGLILPGVGAFPKAMERVRALGLDELVRERLASGVPILGICLGLQLLFESSTELGGADGLGLVEGRVDRLAAGDLKLPQIGWNAVTWTAESPLIEGLPSPCPMYHVHTYAVQSRDVLGTATYGAEFVSAIARPPLYGVQFHPEKSGPHGLRLLANFTRICAGALRRAA
jgi:glutamine amidotransferase